MIILRNKNNNKLITALLNILHNILQNQKITLECEKKEKVTLFLNECAERRIANGGLMASSFLIRHSSDVIRGGIHTEL